jgi:hypothetical protein
VEILPAGNPPVQQIGQRQPGQEYCEDWPGRRTDRKLQARPQDQRRQRKPEETQTVRQQKTPVWRALLVIHHADMSQEKKDAPANQGSHNANA